MDSSQDQMQYDLVPKLYSNAAHNFPAVSGWSAIRYFGNFLAEVFEHEGFKEGVICKFSLECSFSICILYDNK